MTAPTFARQSSDEGPTVNGDTVTRTVSVAPAMCGHNSLFVGQLGDWTWQTVGLLCGVDTLRATDGVGNPTYLSFFYFHIRSEPSLHLRSITFGDRLHVVSRCFDFGSESVLTIHKVTPVGGQELDFDLEEFFDAPRPGSMYVENFNRWIQRGSRGNAELVRSSPMGFRHAHLPQLPDRYSPRRVYDIARARGAFEDERQPERQRPIVGEHHLQYRVDPVRDLNGVRLLYFAAYFSILDQGLLQVFRDLGRSDHSFLDRVVLDQKVCYLGNADPGTDLDVRMRRCLVPGQEIIDTVVTERATERAIAIGYTRLTRDEPDR